MAFTPENTKKIKDLIWDIEGRKVQSAKCKVQSAECKVQSYKL